MLNEKRPESRYLDTNGYRTHYIEQGEGHPVILIHGGGPGADGWGNWFGCLPGFAQHFRTIAIDMAGYGNTEEPADHIHSQPARNQQLVAFIEALGAGPVTVIGNSMGGATGLGAAMARPDLIANLILMGSAGLNYTVGRVAGAMQPIKTFDYTLEGMQRIARHLGGPNFQTVPGMVEYRLDLACRDNRRASFAAIDQWIWANGGLHYEEEEIASVKTRSFVFSGKDDPIVILPQSFRFLELLENSTGYLLPHCGHWAMLEYPGLFTRECVGFIKDGQMGEILGIGLTHYPGPLVPPELWPGMLKQGVRFGMIPEALYADKSRWPAAMLAEWGDDEGVSAAQAHHDRLMKSFATLRAELDAFQPDLVVIWGDDQYENYRLDCVPPFCVGIHDEIVSSPYVGGRVPFATDANVWNFPADTTMTQQGHFEAGHGLTTHLMQNGYDVSWARVLRDPNGLAHSFSNTIVYLDYEKGGQEFGWPVVPIHVNCYGNHIIRAGAGLEKKASGPEIAPPSPSPERCFGLGREVARYFAASPWRVALIGSSSWSHGNLTDKHDHMYPDVEADRLRLAELKSGAYRDWGSIPLSVIEQSGQHEVLNWIALAGAMAELDRDAQVLDFVESHLFNSSKCFALFPPRAQGNAQDRVQAA